MDNVQNWREISKDIYINDNELSEWEAAGVDDNKITEFLKKRFIKEKNMMIIFEIFVSVTGFLGLLQLLMLSNDYLLMGLLVIIVLISNGCLYSNIREKNFYNLLITNKQYQVCDCTAFDIDITRTAKYCYVKDMNGQTLLEKKTNAEPVPMRLAYHGYFTDKEYDAKLLRMKGIENKMHYFVFPVFYLKNSKH